MYLDKLIDNIMEKVHNFTLFDYAIYELCISAFAALFATFFIKKSRIITTLLAVVASLSYIYLIFKIFFKEE